MGTSSLGGPGRRMIRLSLSAELLKKHCLTVTTAESCTGGLLAGRLINAPGISGQFREGYITYSNEAKEKLLGVSHKTLETYGAVSPQTAAEMAEGGARAAGADVCIAVTGIAGRLLNPVCGRPYLHARNCFQRKASGASCYNSHLSTASGCFP